MKTNAFKNGYGIVCQNEKHARYMLKKILKKAARQNSITESLDRRLKAVRHLKCDSKYQISNKYSETVSFLMQKTVTNYN